MTARTDCTAVLTQANARRHEAALAAAHHAIEQLRRDLWFGCLVLSLYPLHVLALIISRPESAQSAIMLARYSIPLVPVTLLLAAEPARRQRLEAGEHLDANVPGYGAAHVARQIRPPQPSQQRHHEQRQQASTHTFEPQELGDAHVQDQQQPVGPAVRSERTVDG